MLKTIWAVYQTPLPTEDWLLQIGAENPDKDEFSSNFYPWSGIQVRFSKTASTCLAFEKCWEYTIIGPIHGDKVTVEFMYQPNGMYIETLDKFIESAGPNWPRDLSLGAFRKFMKEKRSWCKEIWQDPAERFTGDLGYLLKQMMDAGDFGPLILCG